MSTPPRRAQYDEFGNIILSSPSAAPVVPEAKEVVVESVIEEIIEPTMTVMEQFFARQEQAEPSAPEAPTIDTIQWGLAEEASEDISNLPSVQRAHAKQRIVEQLGTVRESCAWVMDEAKNETVLVAKTVFSEGERQLLASIDDGRSLTLDMIDELRRYGVAFTGFLKQPVWVPRRKNSPKQYSRGTLFLMDIGRFGGTFAAIFALLFSAMNYESFAAIASAKIAPVLAFTHLDRSASIQASLAEKLREVPSLPTAGDADGSLSAFMPPVGPPMDMIIIPSLNLRAPIVSPSTNSLLREDWKQLETDIQEALEQGVVHYPGTAEPGQAGNFFLTGHSSYFPWAEGEYKSIFARLGELSVGDEYWIYHGGDKHRYVIDSKKEIVPGDVAVLDQPINKRISTLMTCTPVGTTLRRLILTAQEVDPVSGEPLDVGQHQQSETRPAINIEALPI